MGRLRHNWPLAEYTSWQIGGRAEYFYEPSSLADFSQFLLNWQREPIVVLGAATNVLIRDGGVKGLVIYLRNCLHGLEEQGASGLRVEAGVELKRLVQECLRLGMSQAVFMTGIPGTVGGALTMNAGAYGDFIWNYIDTVETITRAGEIKIRTPKEFVVSYRGVSGLQRGAEWYVAANLVLARGDSADMQQQVDTYLQRRQRSQPLEFPSCGSVFRNPPGKHAARLIEASGLKGRQIGGARVSEKHANFIINSGDATAADVEALMAEVKQVVEEKQGVTLVPEVHIIGEK